MNKENKAILERMRAIEDHICTMKTVLAHFHYLGHEAKLKLAIMRKLPVFTKEEFKEQEISVQEYDYYAKRVQEVQQHLRASHLSGQIILTLENAAINHSMRDVDSLAIVGGYEDLPS